METLFLNILDVGKKLFINILVSCYHSFMPFYSYLHQHLRMVLIQFYQIHRQHIRTLKCPNSEIYLIISIKNLFFSKNELRKGLKTLITFELEIIHGTEITLLRIRVF